MNKKIFITLLLAIAAIAADAQCRYCNTYEDFIEGRWEHVDTVYCSTRGKGRQLWWGGNDFTLTTGDKATDKILKKDAFAVMVADTIYVNCRNLRYENTGFGNGYTKAMRIGQHSLLFVNRIIGSEAQSNAMTAGIMFGTIGAVIEGSKQMKQQVCYLISSGANGKGNISIRLIDDGLMDRMVAGRHDLHDEYYEEENDSMRLLAAHVIPILEKAGLFGQARNEGKRQNEGN